MITKNSNWKLAVRAVQYTQIDATNGLLKMSTTMIAIDPYRGEGGAMRDFMLRHPDYLTACYLPDRFCQTQNN